MFPAAKVVTHYSNSFSNIELSTIFQYFDPSQNFKSLDYDAWSEIMSTVAYIEEYGLTFGRQLTGTSLFFVPRSIWANKPEGTGGVVARYVMTNYTMWFKNISNPIVSEGYVDFHIIGVILYAFLFARLSRLTLSWFMKGDFSLVPTLYICSSVFYIMRGDLISSYSYTLGGFAAIFLLPSLLDYFIKQAGFHMQNPRPINIRKGRQGTRL